MLCPGAFLTPTGGRGAGGTIRLRTGAGAAGAVAGAAAGAAGSGIGAA